MTVPTEEDTNISMDSIELLAFYRQLCEAVGFAKARGAQISPDIQFRLEHVEKELRARLASEAGTAPEIQSAEVNHQLLLGDIASARQEKPVAKTAGSVAAAVFCDGACLGNPGPGGYGIIVRVPGQPERVLSGSKPQTTNNEMELTGALVGIRTAVELGGTEISVQSDSQYLINGITKWVKGWQRNGWKTSTKEPVKNRQLWEQLNNVCEGRSVKWFWTRGHVGHAENERCDSLASAAAKVEADRLRRR